MRTIELSKLWVSQDGLRDLSQLPAMIEFVRNGNFWTDENLNLFALANNIRKAATIEIAEFSDGQLMIHDGHHRCISKLLGGATYLREDEFHIKKWEYSNYRNPNLKNNWFTPFDPITEVRKADFKEFKEKVLLLLKNENIARNFILENKWMYAKTRMFFGLEDLAKNINLKELEYECQVL